MGAASQRTEATTKSRSGARSGARSHTMASPYSQFPLSLTWSCLLPSCTTPSSAHARRACAFSSALTADESHYASHREHDEAACVNLRSVPAASAVSRLLSRCLCRLLYRSIMNAGSAECRFQLMRLQYTMPSICPYLIMRFATMIGDQYSGLPGRTAI